MNRSPQKIILGILLVLALGLVYAGATHRWCGGRSTTAAASENGERKALYWYDAMNPQHHYNQPGKAPDGMDLLPEYGNKETSTAGHESSSASPEMADMPDMSRKTAPAGERKVLYWYDAMNPQHHYNQPGRAPDGMDLLAEYGGNQSMAKMPNGSVTISADKQVLAGVRTMVIERKPLIRDIHTTAQIVADESKIAHIHVKVAGFIDRIYVDYVGQLVKKGQPLFTLYSPDLVSTQEEYLIAKRGEIALGSAPFIEVADGARSLLRSTRERLKLWDISDSQINELDKTGTVEKDLTFYSPITGFVTDRKAYPQTSVTPDTELYTVSDLSTVWAEAAIYEYEVPYVHLGQMMSLTLTYSPGKTYTGKISYIYPTVDPQTRTIKVRVEVPNPGYALKPQMFADAQLRVHYGTKVVVPQEAILDSGTEQVVFVMHEGGIFEPRKVTLGPVIDGNYAVLTGLTGGETVVTSGNFLVDSESRLKSSMGGMKH